MDEALEKILVWTYQELDEQIHDLWKVGDYREEALYKDLAEMGTMMNYIKKTYVADLNPRWGISDTVCLLVRQNREVSLKSINNEWSGNPLA